MENSEIRTSCARADSPPPSFFFLSSCVRTLVPVAHFRFPPRTHADRACPSPSELANRFSKPASRPAHSAIRHAWAQAGANMRLRGKLIGFSAVSPPSRIPPSTRRSLVALHGGSIDEARRAHLSSLSLSLPVSSPPFYVFLFFLTTSHNPNGILSNI